jgi:hypothetical protein
VTPRLAWRSDISFAASLWRASGTRTHLFKSWREIFALVSAQSQGLAKMECIDTGICRTHIASLIPIF